ncbi:MAG: hypothetical protein JXB85_07490, partial [Anaerolineales bacterium]|nr:hypothetical protein [Anaerolineales bacterium]
MISDRDLREWGLLLLLLLLGILLMFAAGQLAIRLTPAWQVEADMGSNINPDEGYANAEGTLVFEPLDPAIMTQPAWAITPSPTPVLVLGTPTPEMSPTVTVTGTTTPTPTVTGTTTVSPTITRTATSTASPTATSTTSNPPILPTNTPVPPPGTIVIVMDSLPSGPQDFSFLGSLGDFALDDDSNPTLPNTRTFPNLPPGTYTVIEGLQAGWTLAGLSCSDGSPVNLGSRAATIHLASNEIVTCTFINASQGTVTIMKDSLPDDPQNFTFSGSLGAFTLDDDANPNYDNALIFAGLLPGTYTVSEGNLPGWTLTNLTCTDPDGGSSGDLGTRTATIDVDLNETILCIFTNSERGSITILKDSQPDDPQDFTFSGSLNAFTLDDDPGDSTLDHLHTFGGLVPGVYTVRENDPAAAGWYLSGLSCSDGSPGDLGTRTASITLDPGEHVT